MVSRPKERKGRLDQEVFSTEILMSADGVSKEEEMEGEAESGRTETVTLGDVCKMEESPYRILKLASAGNLKEVEKLVNRSPHKLTIIDTKGMGIVHHAGMKSRTAVIDFALRNGADINLQDNKGNTPLHTAVERGQEKGLTHLLDKGANPNILNHNNSGAVHVAVELNRPEVLKALLMTGKVDPSLGGDCGATPLHYVTMGDKDELANILLEHGAKLCKPCNIGYYPIHTAAKAGAQRCMEVFMTYAEKMGYKRSEILNRLDKDHNMPLHAAVNSNDKKAVQFCLKYGGQIDAQQGDKSTPIHLAVAQGNLELVQLMLEAQPEKRSVLFVKDAMDMVPLHTAALFNHPDIITLLLDMGSDINSKDKEGRTPLLLSAGKRDRTCMLLLIEKGADLMSYDAKSRNFLHLRVLNGASLDDLDSEVFEKVTSLMNQADDFGCTPIHYASKEGYTQSINGLLRHGANLLVKDNKRHSPLHFAAKYGRINTCLQLLSSKQGPTIINETNGRGLTALHLAAESGHTKVIQLLLNKGSLLHRDHEGNTPLHLAAASGYTQSMKLILAVHDHILDAANKIGDTALHLAARNGQVTAVTYLMTRGAAFTENTNEENFFEIAITDEYNDVCQSIIAHERWEEAMALRSKRGCPMTLVVQHLPDVCLAILDRCLIQSNHDSNSKDFHHHFNFKYLQCPLWYVRERKKNKQSYTPMIQLNNMVKYNRVECLSHPVCVTYLEMKWKAYGFWLHFINMTFYVTFLVFLTALIRDRKSVV